MKTVIIICFTMVLLPQAVTAHHHNKAEYKTAKTIKRKPQSKKPIRKDKENSKELFKNKQYDQLNLSKVKKIV